MECNSSALPQLQACIVIAWGRKWARRAVGFRNVLEGGDRCYLQYYAIAGTANAS